MMPFRLTPTIRALLIANVGLFIVQMSADRFFGANVLGALGLIPGSFLYGFKFWQLLTYSFLHGDVLHLLLNMLMLVFLGVELEGLWGRKRFLIFYFFCIAFAGSVYVGLQSTFGGQQGLVTPLVGASGGIYGLLMAYGLLFGERVLLFMMLFPMKAKHFVWILAGVEFMTSVFAPGRGGLGSAAHLAGMAAGFGYLLGYANLKIALRRRNQHKEQAQKTKRRKQGGHLKLIVNQDKRPPGDGDSESGSGQGPKTFH